MGLCIMDNDLNGSYIDSYPNFGASAIAAFLIPSVFAAAMTHLGILMGDNMSSTWAMATIGFIYLSLCVLIYVLYISGAVIRGRSKLARSFWCLMVFLGGVDRNGKKCVMNGL